MPKMIAACGLECSECPAYLATKKEDAAAIEKIAAQWRAEYGADVQAADVWCDGCLDPGERKCGHCAECAVRACVVQKGLPHCAACNDYPCAELKTFFASCPVAQNNLDALRG